MPNRIIREDILTSEAVDKLDFGAEVFYRRLLSKVDDHGRFHANPQLLLSNCYQLRTGIIKRSQIERWLIDCVKARLVSIYKVDGKSYLQVNKFGQQIRSKSKFPDPCEQVIASDSNCDQLSANAHLDVFVSVGEDVSVSSTSPDSAEGLRPATTHSFDSVISELKQIYTWVNFDIELAKIKAWQLIPKNSHRQITRKFLINWLNKIETPIGTSVAPKQKKPEPDGWREVQRKLYPDSDDMPSFAALPADVQKEIRDYIKQNTLKQ